MRVTHLIERAAGNDARLVARDGFLIMMFVMIAIFGIVLRTGLPAADAELTSRGVLPSATISSRLSDFFPVIVAYMAFYTGALLVGTIMGFVLLDEKDENTIEAMLVSPVPLRWYLLHRAASPALLAFVIVVIFFLFIDQALVPLWQLLLLSAGASLTAPIATLFYATFAQNKVQGFAMAKFVGLAGWLIVLGWFVPEPFQWLFSIFPPFLISKAYWLALEGASLWWAVLIGGVLLESTAIAVLIRRFRSTVYRQAGR